MFLPKMFLHIFFTLQFTNTLRVVKFAQKKFYAHKNLTKLEEALPAPSSPSGNCTPTSTGHCCLIQHSAIE